jgi:hypothetical protein
MENLSSFGKSAAAGPAAALHSSFAAIVIEANAIADPRVVPRLAACNAAPPTPVISDPKRDAWITETDKASTETNCALAA